MRTRQKAEKENAGMVGSDNFHGWQCCILASHPNLDAFAVAS